MQISLEELFGPRHRRMLVGSQALEVAIQDDVLESGMEQVCGTR